MVVRKILLFQVVMDAVMDELSTILLNVLIPYPIVMTMDFGMSQ